MKRSLVKSLAAMLLTVLLGGCATGLRDPAYRKGDFYDRNEILDNLKSYRDRVG
jgi:hypothetical protein